MSSTPGFRIEARLFVLELRKVDPEERMKVLSLMESQSKFCWSCGHDFPTRPDGAQICHCENDE